MTWFKVDDSFYDHPKVYDAPDCAVALWTRAGCWSARNLTDGFVPANMLARFCGDPDTAVRELVKRGLWSRSKGGYLFHDWKTYQPTRVAVEDERKAARERMRNLRAARKGAGQPRNGSAELRPKFATPDPTRPEPPKGGSGSGGGDPSATPDPQQTHPYAATTYGECDVCGLPAGNRRHIRLVGEAS